MARRASVLNPDTGPAFRPFAITRAYKMPQESEEMLARIAATQIAPQSLAQAPDLSGLNIQPSRYLQNPASPVRDELKYGHTISTPFLIGAASQRVIVAPPPNTRRVFLFIVNTHPTQILFVNFGDNATANYNPINPNGGALGFDAFIPQDDIYLIANGANTSCVVTFANKGVNDYPSMAE